MPPVIFLNFFLVVYGGEDCGGREKINDFYNHNFCISLTGCFRLMTGRYSLATVVYEWIRIHKGHPFALSYHIDRLYRSMRLMDMRATIAPDELQKSMK